MLYWTIISFYTIYITCTTHLDVTHIPAPNPDFELVVREVPLKLWGPTKEEVTLTLPRDPVLRIGIGYSIDMTQ